MHNERLAAALDGARFISYGHDGLLLAWFAGHGMHVLDLEGDEVDFFSVGDFAEAEATYAEVEQAADAYRRGNEK